MAPFDTAEDDAHTNGSRRSINIRPNKPECFEGKRDFLAVHTCLYKIEQYLELIQVSHSYTSLSDHDKIMLATTFLKGTASVWWNTIMQAGKTTANWIDFGRMLKEEFIPEDHVRRSRDRLRRLKQVSSVSKYLSDFRNVIVTIPDITEKEKLDKFMEGLKFNVKVEVLKSSANSFEEAAQVTLRVDSAI